MPTHRLNPNKLLMSKWTSTSPQQKEKHFLVTQLIRNEADMVVDCIIEAVINRNQYQLPWQNLTSATDWQQGWK
ncbi:TIGR02450 family Trp-rich protein [Marinomonas sp. IMCC 4694]|uniref:TIGR02450 family Trp-rich protein n=1 Tax=Marinomonas sp. IMCC 4694 TaxID=2605432 RepID=UPI0011E63472|nr:TIGR02450 family Trp-rich protein [Marinomonas sp. IMCC 4694]TYL46882.1 TIGR02450 family Trp-rich protein [Marinomonas sp. IMCC 4694]